MSLKKHWGHTVCSYPISGRARCPQPLRIWAKDEGGHGPGQAHSTLGARAHPVSMGIMLRKENTSEIYPWKVRTGSGLEDAGPHSLVDLLCPRQWVMKAISWCEATENPRGHSALYNCDEFPLSSPGDPGSWWGAWPGNEKASLALPHARPAALALP